MRHSSCLLLLRLVLVAGVQAGAQAVVPAGVQAGVQVGVQAQHVVRGTVTDAVSGESLPSANILIEGTYDGTITNADGAFELGLDRYPATLLFRYIGYESQSRTLTAAADQPLDVRLRPVAYVMPEIVVTDENPALAIMQCVIRRKQAWQAGLHSYTADAYTRFTVSNDTGIVSIIESLSEVFWDRERGSRELLKSQRQTSNLNLATYLPAAEFVTNLYDDDVELAGYEFVGVTHPRAFDTYRFGLQGTRMMDDQLVYDISVRPKNRLKTAFKGRISVLAEPCALIDVALEPGEAFLFPPPIEHVEITFFQQFNSFGGEAWLPADFRSEIELKISMGFLLSFPPFRIRQISRLTNYEVNVEVPDSLFERRDDLAIDRDAVQADTLLGREGVAVPLDTLERMAYRTIDSTMTLDRSFQPTGALARAASRNERNGPDDGKASGNSVFDRLNLEPRLRFNRVEAFHGGLATEHSLGRVRLTGGGAWSSSLDDEVWSYHAGTEVRFGADEKGSAGVAFMNGIEPRYRSRVYAAAMTSLYSLLGGGDYFDYLRNARWTLSAAYAFDDVDVSIGLRHESPRSVESTTAYDLVGRRNEPRVNPAVSPGSLLSLSAAFQVGGDDDTFGFTGRRFARLEVERGLADDLYTRVVFDAEWRITTLFRRRMLPNVLDLHVSAGAGWGDLPVHRLGIVDGSLGPYRPFGALRTRTGRPYQGDRYLGILWEHSFRTVPFELLRLRGLARRGYGIILTGGHARTSLSPRRTYPDASVVFEPAAAFHHEIGLALSGLFGILRIDATARLDTPAVTIGVSSARIF